MSEKAIPSEDDLRAHYAEPLDLAVRKQLDHLDPHCINFIAHSPFLVLATAAADGAVDASPRGDAPGFVRVLDERTLLLPDRRGNNRLDSMQNVTGNPNVGLIFFVPGIGETLRVNGRASIVFDPALLREMAVDGKAPTSALRIEVKEAYLHCAKAILRSRLWSDDYKLERTAFPTLGRMIADQVKQSEKASDMEAAIEDGYRTRLY